jgi:hypothetical protein
MLLGVEALKMMLRGMTSKKLSFAGKDDRYADVPPQQPHPPLRRGLEVVAVRLDIAPKQ